MRQINSEKKQPQSVLKVTKNNSEHGVGPNPKQFESQSTNGSKPTSVVNSEKGKNQQINNIKNLAKKLQTCSGQQKRHMQKTTTIDEISSKSNQEIKSRQFNNPSKQITDFQQSRDNRNQNVAKNATVQQQNYQATTEKISVSRDYEMEYTSFGENADIDMDDQNKNSNGSARPETQIENSGLGVVTKIDDNFGPAIHLKHHTNAMNYQYSATSLQNMFNNNLNLKEQSYAESNTAPLENPLQRVLLDFQKKRSNYINQVRERSRPNENSIDLLEVSDEEAPIKKPTLEEFLEEFKLKQQQVNLTYKSSKLQFHSDMKSFREADIQQEEEMIEKSINEANSGNWIKSETPLLNNNMDYNNNQSPSQQLNSHHQLSFELQQLEIEKQASLVNLSIQKFKSFIPPRCLGLTSQVSLPPGIVNPYCEKNNALTLKQQRSQTVQNFIGFLSDFYDGFQLQPNCLQLFYPKQVQRHLQKRKNQNTDRIVHGLKPPGVAYGEKKNQKAINKMKLLTKCQANLMQAVLLKIDRRSKPIKKQEKIVNENLKKKAIFLDEENFDILTLLQKKQTVEKKPPQPASPMSFKEPVKETVSFQEPMSITKSKPLKSEKDRILSQKEKSGKKQPQCKEPLVIFEKKEFKQVPELKIEMNKTEVVKIDKPLETVKKQEPKAEDPEKPVEQSNLNLNIQPQTNSDMYPFYGSHLGHSSSGPGDGCKACEYQRMQMAAYQYYYYNQIQQFEEPIIKPTDEDEFCITSPTPNYGGMRQRSGSPRRVYSPRPTLNNYCQSINQLNAMSPNHRQSVHKAGLILAQGSPQEEIGLESEMPSSGFHPIILQQVPISYAHQTQVDESSSSDSSEGSSSSSGSESEDAFSGSFGRSKSPKAWREPLSTPMFKGNEIPKFNIAYTPRASLMNEKS